MPMILSQMFPFQRKLKHQVLIWKGRLRSLQLMHMSEVEQLEKHASQRMEQYALYVNSILNPTMDLK